MSRLQVEKRDGRLEEFDRTKIVRAVTAAGLSASDAEALASEVETWATEVAEEGVISSLKIRNRVADLLQERETEAADRYQEYRKAF